MSNYYWSDDHKVDVHYKWRIYERLVEKDFYNVSPSVSKENYKARVISCSPFPSRAVP